ncbi:MAG TPA: cation-transporting P-type ATPase [Desulfobacteraceae bacterium]|nr:cation-transporting P-type ATPase [Desulfobacteraceae bacterium]HPQ27472.1 cation-transporting P-type ATPase [Desulfobacteraceae bacterium]
MKEENNFYLKSVKEVLAFFQTNAGGLSETEANSRLIKYGKNEIISTHRRPWWLKLLFQFKDILIIVLGIAALMSFIIGNFSDGIIMVIIMAVNAVIGYFQEYKAEKIMESLKKLVQSPAKLYREGRLIKESQINLVPGDIVYLEEGDKVPADLRIIEAFNLRTNDFSLTGESMPQEKKTDTISSPCTLADRDNMAYLGTTVAAGNCKGVVVSTGMGTEVGKIANLTQEEDHAPSPLQKELGVIANRISVFAVIIGIILFVLSMWEGLGLNLALIYALGIAVAVVPQALPMQITVALSNGVARLAGKNAVVKKLSSVETLGSTNILATDKTGTLTKNEMTVKYIWFDGREYEVTGLGYEPSGSVFDKTGKELTPEEIDRIEILLDAATMASNAEIHEPDDRHSSWYPVGDPTEAALIAVSTKLGTRSPIEDQENPELHEFSFDSVRKRMSSVRRFDDREVLCMKGATGSILSVSRHILKNGKPVTITDEDASTIEDINKKYAGEAMRVIAIAFRELGKEKQDYVMDELERDVTFLGLMAMSDPPKEGVREAIEQAHEAHIKTFIMTGDHAITARAVGRQIALAPEGAEVPVVTGEMLSEISDDEFRELVEPQESVIFSRVSPEDKLRIVKLLKSHGKIVAVTGDGVNDAPALKSAHIGIAMGGIGTDVSKDASELVILDDSYSTMVYAIREGRTIYNNLKKTILASLTSNMGELTIVLMGLAAVSLGHWPIPILAIQILSIDLIAEILPLTALTFDPSSKTIMMEPPRSQAEHIINRSTFIEVLFFGFLMGGFAFANFGLFMYRTGSSLYLGHLLYPRATTVSFATIAFCQYINIMARRYRFSSLISPEFFNNPKLLWSFVISIGFTIIAIYTPFINRFLGFAPLTPGDWGMILIAAILFLAAHETLKLLRRIKRKREE